MGLISRRDLERAQRQGRAELAVKSCMAHRVWSIGADQSLRDAVALMQTHNVGRLPVLDGKRLIGIITREDVLGYLYDEAPC